MFLGQGEFSDRNPGEFSLRAETDLIHPGAMENTMVSKVCRLSVAVCSV